MDPPCKRLRADYPLGGNTELRLEVHHELTVKQRVHHVVLDGLLLVKLALHSSVEESYVVQGVPLYRLARQRGVIAVPAYMQRPVLDNRNAENQPVLHVLESGQHAFNPVNKIKQVGVA